MATTGRAALGMAAISGGAALGSALSPRTFLRLFGIAPDEVTGAAEFGWRLFAVRTGYLGVLAARGNVVAQEAFLPVQFLDQAVFWHAFATRSVPRRAALLAATASGAIIVLDLRRRGLADSAAA
jgi:hypothetical protein